MKRGQTGGVWLAFLLLLLSSLCSAQPLEHYQRKLTLHQWEQAQADWTGASPNTRQLMEIDFYQARGERDLAWRVLTQIEPKSVEADLKAYFYLLRAENEYGQGRMDLARRNLKAMESLQVSPLLELRKRELTARIDLVDGEAGRIQGILRDFPEHPLKALFFWRILALSAGYENRWVDGVDRWEQLADWALAREEWRLVSECRLAVARQLLKTEPGSALRSIREAVEALQRVEGDRGPETLKIAQFLSYGVVTDRYPDECTVLRGELYEMSKNNRAGWLLAGGTENLPSSYDRTHIVEEALSLAEDEADHLAAAWLSLALVDRIYSRVANRKDYVARARAHLEKLGTLYPGRTPFRDATFEEVEAKSLSFEQNPPSIDRLTSLSGWDRTGMLGSLVSLSSPNLRSVTGLYLDLAESDLAEDSTSNPLIPVSVAMDSLQGNLRSYDPDLLASGRLKELRPYQELFRDMLLERPELIDSLLRRAEPRGGTWEQFGLARLLSNLGRHHEARRILNGLERQSTVDQDRVFRMRVLEAHARSLSRTGELHPEEPLLDRLEKSMTDLAVDGTDTTVNGLLPSIEVLLVTGRWESARDHLDRLLTAVEDDRDKQGHLATSSVYIHRAMVGRLLGEPPEQTLSLLEHGAVVASEVKIWGGEVNQAYRAALLLELGRPDEFLATFNELSGGYFAGTSRLQLDLQRDILSGVPLAKAKTRQAESWSRYLERLNPDLRETKAIERVKQEVLETYPVPPVTTLFLESLRPKFIEEHLWGRRELSQAKFFQFAGELTEEVEGDRAFLLPFQSGYLELLKKRLPEGVVLYHPILLDDRVVKLEISRRGLMKDEFILDGEFLRTELAELQALCSDPRSSVQARQDLVKELKRVLWSPQLDDYERVWFLTPRPLDGVPWPTFSAPGQSLRWTDADLATAERFELSPMVLAGGHPGLRGSKLEIEGLEHLFPDSARWKPDGGLQGLVAMSKKAKVLHVSGHAKGVSEQGGEIDLGPLRVSLAGLFSFQFEDGPLVVLATCEGGAGYDSKRGRSFSLITPFRAAGASRVMANIWALDDKEASVFFMEFYRLLKKDGATPEAALDKLRDRARLSGRHPYYWAGLFLIQGL